jgi:hypothetical protein
VPVTSPTTSAPLRIAGQLTLFEAQNGPLCGAAMGPHSLARNAENPSAARLKLADSMPGTVHGSANGGIQAENSRTLEPQFNHLPPTFRFRWSGLGLTDGWHFPEHAGALLQR